MPDVLQPTDPIVGMQNVTVADFWRWAYSDILSNRNRSIFAEYVVGMALGVIDTPRIEWDSVDLRYGPFKIEVKSSADTQSWPQGRPSRNVFSVRKAVEWDSATAKYIGCPTRCADVYVFCHYPERDRLKVDVLNVPGWDFYVVPVEALNTRCGDAKSVSLSVVKKSSMRCKFDQLRAVVDRVLEQAPRP